jgi:hypothetical protein
LGQDRLNRIALAVQEINQAREELPAWLIVEITPRAVFWLDELDRHLEADDNPVRRRSCHRFLMFSDSLTRRGARIG